MKATTTTVAVWHRHRVRLIMQKWQQKNSKNYGLQHQQQAAAGARFCITVIIIIISPYIVRTAWICMCTWNTIEAHRKQKEHVSNSVRWKWKVTRNKDTSHAQSVRIKSFPSPIAQMQMHSHLNWFFCDHAFSPHFLRGKNWHICCGIFKPNGIISDFTDDRRRADAFYSKHSYEIKMECENTILFRSMSWSECNACKEMQKTKHNRMHAYHILDRSLKRMFLRKKSETKNMICIFHSCGSITVDLVLAELTIHITNRTKWFIGHKLNSIVHTHINHTFKRLFVWFRFVFTVSSCPHH